ncbi:MAG: sugar ABC transporter permease [Clostridia bacterium]|nr:sugar ABC transporter permease [Clostridia bacterium]
MKATITANNTGTDLRKHFSLKTKVKNELWQNRYLYLLAIPVIAYYVLFCYLPMFGLVIAFKQYELGKGIMESQWVGLKYFQEFFGGIYFGRLMRNTLLISFYSILFGFPAPIIFALLMNELRQRRFKKVVQTVTYLPHFISLVVICGMIVDFLASDGVLTRMLTVFGGQKTNYVGDARYFRAIYVISDIWQGIGWGSIIYLAALAGIDQQLYEAAVIDGAGRWKQTLHITLPGILPTIMIMLIMRVGQILSVGYEKIILLYGAGTYEVADVISSYVYRMGIGQSRYSFSAAVGLFQSVVNVILLVAANKTSRRLSGTSLF